MSENSIPRMFLEHACEILANGTTGSSIISFSRKHAIEENVNIPHQSSPSTAPNKRTALRENLEAFPPTSQYRLLKELCKSQTANSQAEDLLKKLVSRYGSFFEAKEIEAVSEPLLEETKHWLESYGSAFKSYIGAEEKYRSKSFFRNLLDDLRLALELLLKSVLQNEKSLENQTAPLGQFLASKGASKELRNMFVTLFDYFAKYQNTYVKHNDAVIEEEIEIIFELASSFIKHLIRLKERT